MAKQIKKHGKIALILALILVLVGMYMAIPIGQAADLTEEKDVITDSRPTELPDHDIKFKIDASTTIADAETVTVQFQGFTSGTVATVIGDWTILHDADGAGAYTALTPTTDWTFTDAGTSASDPTYTFTFTSAGETAIGTNKYIQIQFVNGTDKLANPSAGTYNVDIDGTFGDTGAAMVAIIAGVAVTVTIVESLTVSVNAVTTADCPDFDNTSGNEVATTATTVPFSTVNVDTFYDACQDLRVATNASDGYSATIQETDQLTSGSDQILDGDCDGTCDDTAETDWATAGNNGFGYCMDDQATYGDASATADAGWGTNGCDDADTYFKTIADAGAAETAQSIMSSADGVPDDRSYVGFRLSVGIAQAAGTYSNTIVYIVTPTY